MLRGGRPSDAWAAPIRRLSDVEHLCEAFHSLALHVR
jgi:hypothetical protein